MSPQGRDRAVASAVMGSYLLAALIVTWRLWADPAARTVAGNPQDADQFAWYLRYVATALAHGRLPALVTTALNAPRGINVMWNTSILLPGVLLTPVTLLAGPQTSLTVLTTIGFAGSAASMLLVLRRWRVSIGAAALAGAVYGFSPALLHAAIGHYNLQFAVLPPLIVDAALRVTIGRPGPARPAGGALPAAPGGRWLASRSQDTASAAGWLPGGSPDAAPVADSTSSRSRDTAFGNIECWARIRPLSRVPTAARDGCWLGLLATAQLFTGEELLLITGVAGLLMVAGLAAARPRAAARRIVPALTGLAVAAAVTLVLAGRALWVQFAGPLTQHGSAFLPDYFVNDVSGFVTPSGQQLFRTAASTAAAARYQGGPAEYLAYLGWPLLVLLVVVTATCWRHPAVRALALTVGVLELLSLGGHPLVSGIADPNVNLPWHWLENLPVLGSSLPTRLSIVADGAAAALLALGVDLARAHLSRARPAWSRPDRVPAGRWPVLVIVVAILACLPLVPRPLTSANASPVPAGWTTVLSALGLPPGARVLIVPVPTPTLTLAMRWQADTGRPDSLIGGYFTGPAWNGQAYIGGNGVTATAHYLDQLWIAGLPPGSPDAAAAAGAGFGPLGSAPATSAVRADLAALRPAVVVAITTGDSLLASYLVRLFGPPTIQARDVLAWRM